MFGSIISAVAPAVIGGLFGKEGQDSANQTNIDIARMNNETAIELANSAYQRRVEDLKKAGLNPMLAYTQGGAQVPSLQQARVENSAGSAAQGAIASMTSRLLAAQTEKEQSQAELNAAATAKMQADTRSSVADAVSREIDTRAKVFADANSPGFDRLAVNRLSAENATQMYTQLEAANNYNAVHWLNDFAASKGFRNYREAVQSTEFRQQLVDLRNKQTSGTLLGLKVPEAQAFADMWKSDYGKNVAPYVNSAKSVSDVADKALGMRRGNTPLKTLRPIGR